MRFAALSSLLVVLTGHSLAALTSNAPGILVTVNPDGQTVTVPVLDAAAYAFNPDTKAVHHALRVSPVSSEEASTILLSGQGVAPSKFTQTVTLILSQPAAGGSQFLVTADDDVVPELLHKRSEELPGRVRRAVVGTSSLADGSAGQLLDKRLQWGFLCCNGCMGCGGIGNGGSLCCWEVCCKGKDKAWGDANRCKWWEYCS